MTMNTSKPSYRHLLYGLCLVLLLGACQRDELYNPASTGGGSSLQLSFISDPMQRYNVTTRSSDAKNDAEKSIHNLHIFFFDKDGQWLEGSYLEGYPSASAQGGYLSPGQSSTLIKIANGTHNFTDYQAAQETYIYAVANVKESLFRELDEAGRPQCLQDIMNEQGISNPRDALLSIQYTPDAPIFLTLPQETGMPMIGHTEKAIDLTHTDHANEEDNHVIELKALMARIDMTISLDANDPKDNLPSMILTEWSAYNLPTGVSFTATKSDTNTALSDENKTNSIGSSQTQQIYNRQGEITFSFYMFENVQQAEDFEYPAGVTEAQYQRYKPKRANENAAYVQLKTQYIDTQGDGRDVIYTLYLGANHTDNFAIERNHQYKNNIVIKGMVRYDSTSEDSNTYDARVDMSANTSSYYISMLNEHALDAHFCVLPMDVYFFNTDENTQLKIELDGNPEWIAMERIPADCMENGNLPTTTIEKDNPLLSTGVWHAGHGKRSYFTPTLVSALRNQNNGKETITASRDRIYFYVDENLSATQDRTVTILLTYSDSKGASPTEKLSITQTHFLKVDIYERDFWGNRTDDVESTIYMEQYEEYLDYYDPLDEHASSQVYTGLPWGLNGLKIGDWLNHAFDNYSDGLYWTNTIFEEHIVRNMTLNDVPESAIEYCYNRNKRQTDGSVLNGDRIGGSIIYPIYEPDNRKYFLPGIRQMEDALSQYYTTFKEFQDYFYWSSAAGKGGSGNSENTERARATKIKEDGSYVGSSERTEDQYENGGGSALRTQSLRIRAFRKDLEPMKAE